MGCTRHVAVERQDSSCTYLAHYELESVVIIVVVIIIIILIIISMIAAIILRIISNIILWYAATQLTLCWSSICESSSSV